MANDKETELLLKAKDLTSEAFALVSRRLKELKDESKDVTEKGSSDWGKWFATIGGGVAVGNLIASAFKSAASELASIPGQLLELGKRGNDVSDVRESFNKLNAAIGQTGAETLPQLSSAFGRTINDYELMRSSNEVLSKGVRLTAGDMATMAKAARVMSDQVGGDSKEKWDAMMGAIASGQEKQLRTLPLDYARIDKAVDAYAATMGKEASALTVSQKQIALHNAVLAESKRIVAENGEVQNDFADNLQAAGAQWQNLMDRVGEAIAQSPALNVALSKVSEALAAAFGPDRDAQIASIGTLIGQVAIAAVTGAGYIVSAAAAIASAYYKARAAVDTLFDAYNQKEIARVEGLVKTYEAIAATSEGATSQSKLRLQALRIELAGLKGQSDGLTKDANDALTTNDKLQRSAEDAKRFVANLTLEMQKAEGASKGAAAGTSGLAAAHDRDTESMGAAIRKAQELAHAKELLAKAHEHQAAQLKFEEAGWQAASKAMSQYLQHLPTAILGQSRNLSGTVPMIDVAAVQEASGAVKRISDATWGDIEGRMRAAGVFTRTELERMAAVAREQYSSMLAAGTFTADELQAAWKRMVDANDAAAGGWAASFHKVLASIPQTLVSALTGGGGFSGAMQAIGTNVGTEIGTKAFGPTGFLKGVGEMIPGLGPAIGSLLGPAIGFITKLFSTAGRDAVKDFAATFVGGFDGPGGLHDSLLKLGAEGEAMWVKLTQGNGRNDPKQAAANIAEAKALLAKAAADPAKTIDDDIAAAGFKTRDDLQRTADTAVRVYEAMRDSGKFTAAAVQEAWEKAQAALVEAGDSNAVAAQKTKDALAGIDAEIKSLSDSIAGEAPEEFMGSVEAETRRRIEALAEQRKALEAEQQKAEAETQGAVSDTSDGVAGIRDRAQDTLDVFEKWRDALRAAGEAAGAFPVPGGGGGWPEASHAAGAYIRRDHLANVHAGEMIGYPDFFADALVGAMGRMGGNAAPASSGPRVVQLVVGRRVLTQVVLEEQRNVLGAYGATTR